MPESNFLALASMYIMGCEPFEYYSSSIVIDAVLGISSLADGWSLFAACLWLGALFVSRRENKTRCHMISELALHDRRN